MSLCSFALLVLTVIGIAPAVMAADTPGQFLTDYELVRAALAQGLRREIRSLPVTSDAVIAVSPDGTRNDNNWIVQHELISQLIEGNRNVVAADLPGDPARSSGEQAPGDSTKAPLPQAANRSDSTAISAVDATSAEATVDEEVSPQPTRDDPLAAPADSDAGETDSSSVSASTPGGSQPVSSETAALPSAADAEGEKLTIVTPAGATHSLFYRILDLRISYRPRSVMKFFGRSTQRSALASVSLRLVDEKDRSTVWSSWISERKIDNVRTSEVDRLEMTSSLKKIRSPQSEKWGELFTATAMLTGIIFVAF